MGHQMHGETGLSGRPVGRIILRVFFGLAAAGGALLAQRTQYRTKTTGTMK